MAVTYVIVMSMVKLKQKFLSKGIISESSRSFGNDISGAIGCLFRRLADKCCSLNTQIINSQTIKFTTEIFERETTFLDTSVQKGERKMNQSLLCDVIFSAKNVKIRKKSRNFKNDKDSILLRNSGQLHSNLTGYLKFGFVTICY